MVAELAAVEHIVVAVVLEIVVRSITVIYNTFTHIRINRFNSSTLICISIILALIFNTTRENRLRSSRILLISLHIIRIINIITDIISLNSLLIFLSTLLLILMKLLISFSGCIKSSYCSGVRLAKVCCSATWSAIVLEDVVLVGATC